MRGDFQFRILEYGMKSPRSQGDWEVKRLHLGCGLNTPEGWIHLDGSWDARLAKHPFWRKIMKTFHFLPEDRKDIPWRPDILIHDLRRKLPFGDESIQSIYSSHVQEHLYLREEKTLLKECVRVLARVVGSAMLWGKYTLGSRNRCE